ncbi:hypothetical protein CYY_000949 [Polysphondylium violaceum]|uniref:Nuclear condensin complex subunit 3 C-terminal domain-containing protein n=1 Tax=Polysphondylium violaceum TaxID=133409 RepID=A0A8J4V8F1_9MYCE|nr:hypothetical protein CYY_000949 [Polysphondylium violaceum]
MDSGNNISGHKRSRGSITATPTTTTTTTSTTRSATSSNGRGKRKGEKNNNNNNSRDNHDVELENSIKEILNKTQRPHNSIRELVKQLVTIVRVSSVNRKKTLGFLINQIKKSLAIQQQQHHQQRQSAKSTITPIEGFYTFISLFIAKDYELYENDSFLSILVKVLAKISNSQHYYIRFNTCRFLFMIINQFTRSDSIPLNDDIVQDILQILLVRVKDNKPIVRNISVQSLSRLQDNDEQQQDVAFNSLLQSLLNDELDTVRENIIKVICFKKPFLPQLLSRTNDNSTRVREKTQMVIERELGKGTFDNDAQSWLTIIQYGLKDRNHQLQKKYQTMLCSHIKTNHQSRISSFLSMFSVDQLVENEKTFKSLLLMLFENGLLPSIIATATATTSVTTTPDIDFKRIVQEKQQLAPHDVLMWKVYVSKFSSKLNKDNNNSSDSNNNNNNTLEQKLPDSLELLEYIKSSNDKYTSQNFISIFKCYPSTIINNYIVELQNVLVDLNQDIKLKLIILKLLKSYSKKDTEYFYDLFFKTFQDLRENEIGFEEMSFTNITTKLHCLEMIREIIDDQSPITDDNDINTLFEFIVGCITHQSELVREKALVCFGLLLTYYYFDNERDTLKQFQNPLNVLEFVIKNDRDQVKLAAVKTGFDIIAFRLKEFDDSFLGNFSFSFLNLLIESLHTHPPFEVLYFEGISKLFKQGILLEQGIFDHLIKYYFTPSDIEASIASKQILTCFFVIFPQQSTTSINLFYKSFKSVIQHFLYKEPKNVQKKLFPRIIDFYLEHLKPKSEKRKETCEIFINQIFIDFLEAIIVFHKCIYDKETNCNTTTNLNSLTITTDNDENNNNNNNRKIVNILLGEKSNIYFLTLLFSRFELYPYLNIGKIRCLIQILKQINPKVESKLKNIYETSNRLIGKIQDYRDYSENEKIELNQELDQLCLKPDTIEAVQQTINQPDYIIISDDDDDDNTENNNDDDEVQIKLEPIDESDQEQEQDEVMMDVEENIFHMEEDQSQQSQQSQEQYTIPKKDENNNGSPKSQCRIM